MLFRMVTLARDLHYERGHADAAAWVIPVQSSSSFAKNDNNPLE